MLSPPLEPCRSGGKRLRKPSLGTQHFPCSRQSWILQLPGNPCPPPQLCSPSQAVPAMEPGHRGALRLLKSVVVSASSSGTLRIPGRVRGQQLGHNKAAQEGKLCQAGDGAFSPYKIKAHLQDPSALKCLENHPSERETLICIIWGICLSATFVLLFNSESS